MKKFFMIALAGMMMLAFTQCNKGSKEFKEKKSAIETAVKNIEKAKTCEELATATAELDKIVLPEAEKAADQAQQAAENKDANAAKEAAVSAEELAKLSEQLTKAAETAEKKAKELKCE